MPNTNATRSRSNETPADSTTTPVERFHEGSVHVSIWEKTGAKGIFRTASFQLRYRNGDHWHTSNSYSLSDLDSMEKAAREARARIEKWQSATLPEPAQRNG